MKRRYEAWDDGNGDTALVAATDVERLQSTGAIASTARRLHIIEADTFEEAAAVHAIKMGWGAYDPGPSAPCPQGCGAYVYPERSGECPNCGRVV